MEALNLNSGLLTALSEVAFLVLGGYIARKSNFFKDDFVKGLTSFIIYICLPSLVFYSFISHFSFDTLKGCSLMFLFSFVIFFLGFLIGLSGFKLFIRQANIKREFVALNAFQNSGYLPLALAANLFVAQDAEIAYLYIFSYLIGFNLIMLSFGFYYIKRGSGFSLKNLITPPFVASILGIAFALSGLADKIPNILIEPVHKVGEATIPLGMIVLGMILAQSKIFTLGHFKDILVLVFSKLLVLPVLVLIFINFTNFNRLISFIVVLQAAMPSATTLSLIANFKDANTEFVAQGIVYTHLFLVVSLPLIFFLFQP